MKLVEEYADVIQVGARNVQNFDLLKAVGKAKKPVLLKRGLATRWRARTTRPQDASVLSGWNRLLMIGRTLPRAD